MKRFLTPIKIFVVGISILVINTVTETLDPLVKNNLAKMQMQNSDDGYYIYELYQKASPYGMIIPVIIAIILFKKEIINAIKNIIKKCN